MNSQTNIIDDNYIKQIIVDSFEEFGVKHGTKYLEQIKKSVSKLEINRRPAYVMQAPANAKDGCIDYAPTELLAPILKHELCHVYNNNGRQFEKIPEKYIEILEKQGKLQEEYLTKVNEIREQNKRYELPSDMLNMDYEEFKRKYVFCENEGEKWTEWLKDITYQKDNAQNFWDWNDGYFTSTSSSPNCFYDCFLNIQHMLSNIIPQDKLVEAYMQTDEYKKEYSYDDMIEEIDTKYANAINAEEKEQYGYPYFKIISDTKAIYDNIRNNPEMSRQTLQSAMKTCINMYQIKLNDMEFSSIEDAKKAQSEIKDLQKNMMYNTDISKMKTLEYVKSMQEVQKTFERKVKELNITKNEKKELLKNIDYKKSSPYKCNKKMQKVISAIDNDQNNKKNKVIDIAGKKINVGKNGIKGNLYSSLNSLFGQEKLNLIYDMPVKEGDVNKNEYIIDIFQDIEKSHSDQEYIQVYSQIYEMFAKQMQENLKVDQNITYLFARYGKNIIELQKNAPIGMDNKYLLEFENMLQVYNTKYAEYMKNIDKDVELAIQEDVSSGRPYEKAKASNERMAGFTKDNLAENIKLISEQRQKQINDISNYKENIKWYQFARKIKNNKDKERIKELPSSKTEESISHNKNIINELHKMVNEAEFKDENYTSKTRLSIDEKAKDTTNFYQEIR